MIEWLMLLLIGTVIGIYAEKVRREGRGAIPFELRYWFSQNLVALFVCTPIVIATVSEIGFFVSAFLRNDFLMYVNLAIMFCCSPFLFWFMWISRARKPKEADAK